MTKIWVPKDSQTWIKDSIRRGSSTRSERAALVKRKRLAKTSHETPNFLCALEGRKFGLFPGRIFWYLAALDRLWSWWCQTVEVEMAPRRVASMSCTKIQLWLEGLSASWGSPGLESRCRYLDLGLDRRGWALDVWPPWEDLRPMWSNQRIDPTQLEPDNLCSGKVRWSWND